MKLLSFFTCFLYLSFTLFSQNEINKDLIAENLNIPVDISFDHQNQMYVVEKRGIIVLVKQNGTSSTNQVFLNITNKVNSSAGERGLLGLVFHPDYETNGYFFVNYTNTIGSTVVARYKKIDGEEKGDPNSEKKIITIPQPYNNHNGGDLNFDKHGYLYIGMGDGGSGGDPENYSQRPKELLGKMLRLDINTETSPYLIPESNPYKNNSDTLPEIWALGLRNPWRFSFDKNTDELWIGDVGQNKWEEVNVVDNSKGGKNFGWKCYEGKVTYDFNNCNDNRGYIKPVAVYQTSSSGEGCSITGGYVYTGNNIPKLKDEYIFGDFCSGNIWALKKQSDDTYARRKIYKINPQELSTFGQDNDGEIYYAELGNGKVYRVKDICAKRVLNINTIPVYCVESKQGSAVFEVSGTSPYELLINNTTVDLNKLSSGIYNYQLKDIGTSCIEEGTFEIKNLSAGNVNVFKSNLMDVTLCNEYQYSLKLDSLTPRPDSVEVNFNNNLYILKDEVIFDKSIFIKSAYIQDCKIDFILPFQLTFSERPSPPSLEFNSDTLVIVKGDFVNYIMVLKENANEIFATSTDGVFKQMFTSNSYLIYGINNDGCKSAYLEFDIISSSENPIMDKDVVLNPNPATNELTIQANSFIRADIYNMSGKKILSNLRRPIINISSLPSGKYMIKIYFTNNRFIVKTFIKIS